MIEFVWWFCLLLLPLPLVFLLLPVASQQSEAALKTPPGSGFRAMATGVSGFQTLRWPKAVLWLIWLLLLIALARPQWAGDVTQLPVSGRDLLLAVDISGSMIDRKDMVLDGRQVTKLTMVKKVVADFIQERTSDRIGLILFGTHAYLQAPLTFDTKTVEQLLAEVPSAVAIAGTKTAMGDAIGLAVKQLTQKPKTDKILILLTDGKSNAGEVAPLKAAQLAAQADVRIYTIGIGAGKTGENNLLNGLLSFNLPRASDLDEAGLQQIAKTTKGHYFRADNTEQLIEIYRILNEYEPIMQPAQSYRPIQALAHYPLALAFVLSLLLAWYLAPAARKPA